MYRYMGIYRTALWTIYTVFGNNHISTCYMDVNAIHISYIDSGDTYTIIL